MINVQIYGDTEAWLRRAAEESGWTFDERKVELEDVTVLNIG
jgi:hypothetical protein